MAQATAFNVSVVFRAETAEAKAGMAEIKRSLTSIGAATGQASGSLSQNVVALDREAAAAQRAAQQQDSYTAAVRRATEARNVAAAAPLQVVARTLPTNLTGMAEATGMAGTSSSLAIANTNLTKSFSAVGAEANAARLEGALYRQEMDAIRAQYNPLFAASMRYEQQLRDIAEAERLGAISAIEAAAARNRAAAALVPMANGVGRLGASASAAAAYTQNLTFQVNDIAMMMAAGQNPFMLMMQQGTAVTQVFGQMRASGMSIGTALRTSLMSMIRPANLVTMAVIGVGAAAAQYFMSAAEDAKTLDDAIDDLKVAGKDLSTAMIEANRSIFDLRGEFGDGAAAAREMNLALLELARIDALDKVTTAAESISAKFGGLIDQVDRYDEATRNAGGALRDDWLAMAQTSIRQIQNEFGLTIIQATQVAEALEKVGDSSNVEGVVSGFQQIAQVLASAKDESGNIPPELRATARAAAEAAIEALRLQGNTEEIERITKSLAGVDLGKPFRDANAAAATLAGTIASLNLSNIGKAAQLAALQAGGSQSSAEVAGKVAEKRAELDGALNSPDATTRSDAEAMLSSYEAGLSQDAALSDQISEIVKARTAASRASSGAAKSEASEAKKAAESINDLIASKRLELDIIRETDPVQKELLRYREQMSGATSKQKAELDQLIPAILAEGQAMQEIKSATEDMRSTMSSSFSGLVTGADDLGDALGRVLDKFADMAASSAFDILWDAGGGGKFFDGVFSWLIPGKADGGQVIGAGGPRDDNLLHWLSNGEFVVNAASTSQYLPLLEAINAGMSPRELMPALLGRVPALADGGRVGVISAARLPSISGTSASAGATTPSGTIVLQATINLAGARGDREIEQAAAAGMRSAIDQALDHYDRLILPQRVAEIGNDPRTIG